MISRQHCPFYCGPSMINIENMTAYQKLELILIQYFAKYAASFLCALNI
jgi:hypothetical protein